MSYLEQLNEIANGTNSISAHRALEKLPYVRKPSEKKLYEFELARLAVRQCSEFFQGNSPVSLEKRDLCRELERKVDNYDGLKVRLTYGGNLFVNIKPKVLL